MSTVEITEARAYHMGRNSIGDDGEVFSVASDHPELSTDALIKSFKQGVRDIKSELRLNDDFEWDA